MNFLTDEENERYQRQIVLKSIGKEEQELLKKSRVAIVGLGGLGSISAMYL
ncbi:MAG: ThiF family adenylyltransferase, partial [Candidatus Wukongarchaeota archaeon]|nr:ThiF family adenylyltransferase [Candidatus Wukongarchaeota archaeon]